jgi:hypothetical protein
MNLISKKAKEVFAQLIRGLCLTTGVLSIFWNFQANSQQQNTTIITSPISGSTADDTRFPFAAAVRLARENPAPEVFFVDGSAYASLRIATNSTDAYNRVMNAVNNSIRTRQPAKLLINKKTGLIVDADGVQPSAGAGSIYDDGPDDYITSPQPKNNTLPAAPGGGGGGGGKPSSGGGANQ